MYKCLLNKDSKKRKLFNLEKILFLCTLKCDKKSINKHFAKKKEFNVSFFYLNKNISISLKKGK